ncbi:MAG: flavodoxin domain-containing protein [Anaerolineales bacterium]|nr:flavodoxin domain-containing protein [Anaerolineales bacterium]
MDEKVLIAYASKYGATAEIALQIGKVIQDKGFAVEVHLVEQVKDLAIYGAIVLGSAVYAGQWLKGAANFLTAHESTLAERPLWIFSSGPTGEGDPQELMKGWRFPENLQPIADRIAPRDIAFFSGVLDPKKLNLPEKMIIKALKAPTGDFRDWESIEAWAASIAESLQAEQKRDAE